ncbi:YdbH domain-containing protein [Shewanella youngdeokensis]|uniref:YdbH domain-containing protein n=1 Tax=Shewanella youngdeokensis TaxID=2999068 RepID=A0ABZ0K4N9_9GAMM|nr:YdbH domain-containing protein [Shewanella sp. DAU334]
MLTPANSGERPQVAPSLRVSINTPLTYHLNNNQLSLAKAAAKLEHSKLSAALNINNFNYSPAQPAANTAVQAADSRLVFAWQLLASHRQHLNINALWPTLTKLPTQLAVDKATLSLEGQFTALNQQDKSSYALDVQPNASLITQGVSLSHQAVNHGAKQAAETPTSFTATSDKIALTFSSNAQYRKSDSQTHIIMPALAVMASNLQAKQQQFDQLHTQYRLKADSVNIGLSESTAIELGDKYDALAAMQWLNGEQRNHLAWSLDNLLLDKSALVQSTKKSSRYSQSQIQQTLLKLDRVDLNQQLNLSPSQLSSDDTWQINGLNLFSQHQYQTINNSPAQFQVTGDWQFQTDFEPIIAFLSQSDSLPDSLQLNGNADLNLHYRFNKTQDSLFELNFSPYVTDIAGHFANLPFEGGNIRTQCQFKWLQRQAISETSNFNCEAIDLSLQAFNPGILITDIKAQAAIAFSTDANQTVTDTKHHNLALPAEIFGITKASVNLTANGDLLNGQLLIPQFQLNLKKPSSAYFVLQRIDLKELLSIYPQVGISADGIFDGVLPVTLEQGKVAIKGGQLAARAPGGLIVVDGNPAVDQMRLSQPYLEFAFSALEHLTYTELSSYFDMDAQGDALLKVNVKGHSRGMERPTHLNYSQEENMLQLLRSLQIGNNLQNQIESSIQ